MREVILADLAEHLGERRDASKVVAGAKVRDSLRVEVADASSFETGVRRERLVAKTNERDSGAGLARLLGVLDGVGAAPGSVEGFGAGRVLGLGRRSLTRM